MTTRENRQREMCHGQTQAERQADGERERERNHHSVFSKTNQNQWQHIW